MNNFTHTVPDEFIMRIRTDLGEIAWHDGKLKDDYKVYVAEQIVIDCFSNIKRRNGSYVLDGHIWSIADLFHDYDYKLVAILHDVIEDSSWTLEHLLKIGFDKHIVDAVDALTRRIYKNGEREPYLKFIERCARNEMARHIKVKDIKNNMTDPENLKREKILCYEISMHYLNAIIHGKIRPETKTFDYFLRQQTFITRHNMTRSEMSKFILKHSANRTKRKTAPHL